MYQKSRFCIDALVNTLYLALLLGTDYDAPYFLVVKACLLFDVGCGNACFTIPDNPQYSINCCSLYLFLGNRSPGSRLFRWLYGER